MVAVVVVSKAALVLTTSSVSNSVSEVALLYIDAPFAKVMLPPWIVIFPVKLADKSEERVKIVSSILFNPFPLLSAAVADLKTMEPPTPVPVPAPPANIKSPPDLSF